MSAARRLVLLRHAKAERPPAVRDHDRWLTARGHRDAAATGEWLAGAGLRPDLVLCSSARRTVQTWASLREGLGVAGSQEPELRVEPDLYEASPAAVVNLVAEAADDVRTVLVVGHQPTLSQVAVALAGPGSDERLLGQVRAGLPTAGAAVLETEGPWSAVEAASLRLTALHTP